MEKNLALTRKSYVESEQAHMVLGTGKGTKWTEIEADEAVFDKCLIAAEDVSHPSRTMKWDQWLGMVPRGKPSSLVLFRLRSLTTHKRAPGPGAVRKDDWVKIANAWLKDRSIILHTDSARSYRTKIRGVLHDAVIHQKKRIFHGGKWVWKSPTFVCLAKHKLPNGRKITVKAGTQVIDRAWRFLKDRVKINQNAKTGSTQLAAKIRAAQYEYWQRGSDMWASTGTLLTWYMSTITSKHGSR